jgi:ComF family protein
VCEGCAADLPRNDRACEVCALPLADGVHRRCGHCSAEPPLYAHTVAPFVYAFPVDRLVQSYKYQALLALAGWFADAMLAARASPVAADLLVPMPLTRARQRERGFNQSLELAKALARATGVPVAIDGVRRVRDAAAQATLPWAERRRNMRGAFACIRAVRGLRIVVVDDVMTTGASLDEMARVLLAAGAASVENWVIARTPAPHTP